jgi:hypothetical protein
MSKTSEAQWPESSSEDDFASQKCTKKMIKKASLATSARKRKQNRSTEVNGSKALTLTDGCGEDLDIVATIGAPNYTIAVIIFLPALISY